MSPSSWVGPWGGVESRARWAATTRCVGPWDGGGPKTLEYDIAILGAGYDPENVLTCICHRCGKAWSYDSPSGECPSCERETLIEILGDENKRLCGEPPAHRKPPPIPPYEVVAAPSFVKSCADAFSTDEASARASLRGSGVYLQSVRPTPDDADRDELRRYMKEWYELDYAHLDGAQQERWREWWATREDLRTGPRG